MKVILVSLEQDISELINLAESLNYEIVQTFIQKRTNPSPKYYIGDGKAEEIAEYIKNNDIDIIIINAHLKASQIFNLQKIFQKEIFDRIRLILEIFTDRAHSKEAQLQVELARLQYEVPLVNEWVHRSVRGEHPGFMAGGEYAVQQYYDLIRKRIKKNKEKLERLKKERMYRRGYRRRFGNYLVSIAGYTNAGKSTLLNSLTGSNVVVEKRMFSTLTTTTRKIQKSSRQILLTDTVGFIKDLPPWLIEAFHSTLEEIFYSDIILLTIDISEEIGEVIKKINTCYQILWDSDNIPLIIPVFNKIDLVDMQDVRQKINKLKEQNLIDDYIFISAREKLFLEDLIEKIHKSLPELVQYKIEIFTMEAKSIINFIKENFYVNKLVEEDIEKSIKIEDITSDTKLNKKLIIEFECDIKEKTKVEKYIRSNKGVKLTTIE